MSVTPVPVLVADDDVGIRSSVVEILRGEGYLVREAEDGDVALAELAAEPVAVMLLDVRMPKLDGIGVLAALDEPPVTILVSAYALDGDLRRQVGDKIFKYLRKPVPPTALLAAVAEACERAAEGGRSGDPGAHHVPG